MPSGEARQFSDDTRWRDIFCVALREHHVLSEPGKLLWVHV